MTLTSTFNFNKIKSDAGNFFRVAVTILILIKLNPMLGTIFAEPGTRV